MQRHRRPQIASYRLPTLPARLALIAAAGSVLAAMLGGCVYSKEKERVTAAPPPVVVAPPAERVVVAPTERVVASSEGRWQLYGDGTSAAPYYWAWIPAGASPPPPPALPRAGSIR
jgi:hypothetical protein